MRRKGERTERGIQRQEERGDGDILENDGRKNVLEERLDISYVRGRKSRNMEGKQDNIISYTQKKIIVIHNYIYSI